MILTHLTQPILADSTALYGLCGTQYARRDPRTLEVWHEALAIAPERLAYMQRTYPGQYTYCPACVALNTALQTDPPARTRPPGRRGRRL